MEALQNDQQTMLNYQFSHAKNLMEAKRFVEAANILYNLLERLPEKYSVISNLAFVSEKQGKLKDSLKLYEYGFKLNPSGRDQLYNYGRALQRSGDFNGSEAVYR